MTNDGIDGMLLAMRLNLIAGIRNEITRSTAYEYATETDRVYIDEGLDRLAKYAPMQGWTRLTLEFAIPTTDEKISIRNVRLNVNPRPNLVGDEAVKFVSASFDMTLADGQIYLERACMVHLLGNRLNMLITAYHEANEDGC